jgi:uncharacterized protein YndB with AHSA1/START domain
MTEPATRSIVVEREIPHAPEKIWRALTQPHLIEEWLMKNDFRPEVGAQFTLQTEPQPGMKIVIDCKVREIQPHKELSYDWNYIVGDPAFDLRSVVTFTLTPTPTGTTLRMEQTGFRPEQKQAFGGGTAAWKFYLEALETTLAKHG